MFACVPPSLSYPYGLGHGKGAKRDSFISYCRPWYSVKTCLKLFHSTVDLCRGGGYIVVYRAGTKEPLPSTLFCPTLHPLLNTGDGPGFGRSSIEHITEGHGTTHSLASEIAPSSLRDVGGPFDSSAFRTSSSAIHRRCKSLTLRLRTV